MAAVLEHAPPEQGNTVTERAECATVGRHRVEVEVAFDDLPQPFRLYGYRLVHPLSQFLFDGFQLRPHAVTPGFTQHEELATTRLAADKSEAQEVEGLRFTQPAPLAIDRGEAAKLNQSGLFRMKRQRKTFEPLAHRVEESPGIHLALKTHDDVVGVSHDDHVTRGLVPSPAFGPQVEDVVQVDVGEQRRDHRTLSRTPVTCAHDSVFQDTHLQPFLDQ